MKIANILGRTIGGTINIMKKSILIIALGSAFGALSIAMLIAAIIYAMWVRA